VRDAGVGPSDAVLEVGTGTGILTDHLADRAGRVVTCDLDADLLGITRGLRDWPESVTFVQGDVLAGKHALNPVVLGPWLEAGDRGYDLRVVANLPYAVATPLLANLLWSGIPFRDATVLVQKEAAERFTARPSTREYGPMAIAVALLAEARVLRPVGRHVFWPEPKVESAVLSLRLLSPVRAREWSEAGLPALLREVFLHRRKVLRGRIAAEALGRAGVDPALRPEQVDPALWPLLLTVPPS